MGYLGGLAAAIGGSFIQIDYLITSEKQDIYIRKMVGDKLNTIALIYVNKYKLKNNYC